MGYLPDFCTGGSASASSVYGVGYEADKAFDDDTGTYWDGYPASYPGAWIKYDLGVGITKVAQQYTIKIFSTSQPQEWNFEGSNNDSDWDVLDHLSGQSFSSYEKRTFPFANSVAYRYYRLYFIAYSSPEPAISEIEMMEADFLSASPPVVALTVTAHTPHAFMPIAFVPVAALETTSHAPHAWIAAAFVPVVELKLTAPQNTETPLYEAVAPDPPEEDLTFFGSTYGNGFFVSVGYNNIFTSPDGVTWTRRTEPSGISRLKKVLWNGAQFIAVGGDDDGNPHWSEIITSPDGIEWTLQTPIADICLYSIAWNGSFYVAGGRTTADAATYSKSVDGVSWSTVILVSPFVEACPWSIVWTGSQFVAVGQDTSPVGYSDFYMATSPDGVAWTDRSNGSSGILRGVAWNGSLLCAVGITVGASIPIILTSTDGITWTEYQIPYAPNPAVMLDIKWVGTGFVASGYGGSSTVYGYLLTSEDGIGWTVHYLSTSAPPASIAWDGSARMVIMGSPGSLFYAQAGAIPFQSFARNQVPLAGIELSVYDPSARECILRSVPVKEINVVAKNPSAWWELNPSMLPASQVIYLCTLTGAPDAVDDILIPLSSFQATLRSGDPSYLACVVPNSTDWEAAITARPNGEIVIQKGYRLADGTTNLEEIARVNFESLQVNRGARHDSATIVGHKTVTATAAKEWTVQGVSFYGLTSDGKRRIRAAMDLFLRPGDVCIYGAGDNDSFVVGSISYAIDSRTAFMEVAEA